MLMKWVELNSIQDEGNLGRSRDNKLFLTTK